MFVLQGYVVVSSVMVKAADRLGILFHVRLAVIVVYNAAVVCVYSVLSWETPSDSLPFPGSPLRGSIFHELV
jgi:hypothetical protein